VRIVRGCSIVTLDDQNPFIPEGELEIDPSTGTLTYVGPIRQDVRGEVILAKDKVAMPGLVNAHTHAAMTIVRGYADDLNLQDWLSQIWAVEARMSPEDIYWGTQLALAEMIRGGTIAFADMYFHMEHVARAVADAGMRVALSPGLLGILPGADKVLQEAEALARDWHGAEAGRIRVILGPHAPYTCPPEYLRKVAHSAARLGVGVHIHLSETRREVEDSLKQYGKTPIELAHSNGLFQVPVLAAHCVHATDSEIDLLAETGAWVAHNMGSNLKLGSGIAPIPRMLSRGVRVALGTDGAGSNNNLDMFEEMYLAATVHKGVHEDATLMPAPLVMALATRAGAQALGFEDVGILKPGYQADFLLVSLKRPHMVPAHSLPSNLVYSARSADVDGVFVAGRPLMLNGSLLTIDEERAMAEVAARARNLTGKD
jgi:5-methylthioadenosine/S-adenosylhomocysteine deaminase